MLMLALPVHLSMQGEPASAGRPGADGEDGAMVGACLTN